ncbi:MAG: murein transglycosylase, partial [Fluviibacter sp.]
MSALMLAGCATSQCPPCKEAAKPVAIQVIKPLKPANWTDLPGWADDQALAEATPALLQSCSTRGKKPGWQDACNG